MILSSIFSLKRAKIHNTAPITISKTPTIKKMAFMDTWSVYTALSH